MTEKRIIIVNRTLDTLTNPRLAGILNGEWFYVQDRKCIYWKHPVTGTVQAITDATTVQGSSISWGAPSTYIIEGSSAIALEDGKTKIGFLTPSNSTGGTTVEVAGVQYPLYSNTGTLIELGTIRPSTYIEAIYVASKSGFQVISDIGTSTFGNGVNVTGKSNFDTIASKNILEKIVALGESNVILPKLGGLFTKTITGNTALTIDAMNGMTHVDDGQAASFILEVTNGGSFVVTWDNGIRWDNSMPPILTAIGVTSLGFYSIDKGLTWRGVLISSKIS